jgi:hypothetical protein
VVAVDWRELLGNIISNSAERERIANEIGVHSVTLVRWVNGETSPRSHNLRQLVRAVPKQYRTQLRALLDTNMAISSSGFETDSSSTEIPYKLILEVLEARANTPDLLRFWTITRLILPEALKQLDSERQGMIITVVRCMPPTSDGKIRSLRETVGQGTGPWNGSLEEKALLLGAESLAGYVTSSCRLEQVGDLRSNRTFLPAYQGEHEISAIAGPIMRACRVAGCLLFSSTQPDYFASETYIELVSAYTRLISLAFDASDFYSPDLIDLHIMPPLEVQQVHISSFRQRVLKLMQESSNGSQRLASAQAEQLVWQQFEELLLNLPRSSS